MGNKYHVLLLSWWLHLEKKVLANFLPQKPGRGCCVFVRSLLRRPISGTSEECELRSRAGQGCWDRKGGKSGRGESRQWRTCRGFQYINKKILEAWREVIPGLERTDALAMSFLGPKIVIPKLIKSQAARKPVRNVCRVTYTVGNWKRGEHKNTLNYKCKV